MTMVRGAYSHLLAPGFRKIVFETYNEAPLEGNQIVNMQTSNRAYEEDVNMGGFGTLLEKVEGGPIKYEDPTQGLPKRYVWRTYGLGFRITQEMMEDDLYGIVGNKLSRALGRSARHNFELVAAAPFNNAFDANYYGFEANVPLISTLHATLRGGAAPNRPLADTDLDIVSLQAAVEHFHGLTDESGMRIVYTPRKLIVGVSNMWNAWQLTQNPNQPASPNSDINFIQKEGLVTHVNHYLNDPDAWFIQATQHDVNYFDRRKPTFSNTDDFETGDAKYKLTRRNGSGFGDWRGMYGSPGI